MRARRDRFLPTALRLTQLEDRSVPAGFDVALPPPPPFTGPEGGLNTMPVTHFLGGSDFLTGPQAGDPLTLAKQALAGSAAALGLTAADVANPVVSGAYADATGSQVYHAYFTQSHNGLEVFNTSVGVHVMPDGRVLAVTGGFVNLPAPGAVAAPVVSADAAVAAAASYFGISLASAPVLSTGTTGGDYRSVVSEPELSRTPITTRLVYVNTPAGVRTAWEFNMDVPAPDAWYNVAVDAATGQVTFWSNWTNPYSATYNALKLPTIDPTAGPRTLTVNPWDVAASPFGWHDTNGASGAEFTDTRGNNVFAQYDPNDSFLGSNNRPDGGADRVFNNPLNLLNAPSGSSDASTTNLFYLNNILHDVHFKYGFDEAAGNFQFTNYTGQGLGGDHVLADALDGSALGATNNAFMSTPPDGSNPNMIMLLWDYTTPNRDSSFAADVIVHEYGHGVSTRLTGGPANSNSLSELQSNAMGEGWSDYWALMFTQSEASTRGGAYPVGAWLDPTVPGAGIRRFPYSTDLLIQPVTFDQFGDTGFVTYQTSSGPQIVFRSTQQHAAGEIWASTLWDLNWLLIDKYGYDKDLSTGYSSTANGPAGAGNKLALQLVMDGLKLQPVNPTFIEARDAILLADTALTGGRNHREIWTSFARRGLGFGAFTSNVNDNSVSTSFAMPLAGSLPAVIAVSPVAKTIGGGAPASITFTFSEGMDVNSFDPNVDVLTFTAPSGGDLRGSITGFQWIRENPLDPLSPATKLQIFFTPPVNPAQPTTSPTLPFADQGNYQMRLSANILSADTPTSPLDQNLDGNPAGPTVADQFVANFRYDAQALTAVLTSIPSAANPAVPGAIFAVFSEPVAESSLAVTDLQVSQGSVSSFSVKRDVNGYVTGVQYNLTGVTNSTLYATMKYGAVTDLYGFPVEEVNKTFGRAVIPAVDFPTPIPSYGALGWESFGAEVVSDIVVLGDSHEYAITLDAGQTLSVIGDRITSLRAQLRLFDPDGNPIALVTGAQAGDPVSIGPVSVPTPGRYVVQISGSSNSSGPYRLRALIGTTVEGETADPAATNDTQFTAEALNGRLLVQGGPGSTLQGLTVAGNVGQARSGSGGPFNPGDILDNYSFTAVAGVPVSVGLTRAAGGAPLTLLVTDAFGTPVGGAVGTPTNFDLATTFTPTANGTFRIQVGNNFVTARGVDYALTLALNAVIDREPNNDSATAQPVPLNANVRGGITAGDQDWYSFTLTAPTDVYLTSLTPGDGPNQPDNFLNPTIEVFDPNGDLLTSSYAADPDNAAGDGKNALFYGDNLIAGTYRFRVRSSPLAGPTVGEYVVRFSTDTDPAPLNVSAGGPYTVSEGSGLVLSASATDPNEDPASPTPVMTYTWDLNGDGVYGDATGRSPTLTWAQLRALGIADGPATFTIRVQVSDGGAPVTSLPSSIVLNNGNPLAALYIGTTGTATTQTVNEGVSGLQVRLASPFDSTLAPVDPASLPLPITQPLSVDDIIGLKYSFDLNNDGVFNDGFGDGSYAGSLSSPVITLPASLFLDGPGTGAVTISAMVIDKDNGATITAPVTFTITNLNPTLGTTLNGTLRENQDSVVTVVGSTDPSAADQASLRYSFDLDGDGFFDDGAGDGTYAGSLTTNSATVPASFLPDGTASATATIRVQVFDKDGGFSSIVSFVKPVLNSAPTATVDVLVGGSVMVNPAVAEGSGATIRITNVVDPSSIDNAGPFTYEYDFGYDAGVGFVADVSSTTLTTVDVPVDPFLNDGNTTVTVGVRVIDKDGGFTIVEKVIAVNNVAPVGTLGADPVTIGQPSNVRFTGQFDPSTVDAQAGYTYVFSADLNGDGDTADLGEVQSGSSSSAAFTFASPGNKTVFGTITDKDGDSTSYSATVVVENVQPGATLTVPPTVVEGGTASVTVVGSHPSAAVVAAGFTFEFDFDGDGNFDLTVPRNPAAPQSSITVPVPASFLADGLRPLTVRVRVTESFNDRSAEFTAPLQVLNGNPTATFSGPTAAVQVSDQVTFSFTNVTDPSLADRAGLRFSVDLNNDGDFADDGEILDSPTATVTTQFRTSGVKTVRGRVTDKDGGATDYLVPVTVNPKVKGGFAAGVDAGNAPLIQLYDASGNLKFRTNAFDSTMTGGVRVAVADVNGDGVADVVAGSGPGGVAEIRVIDGRTGTVVFSSQPFEGFTGGVFVAAGDMDGDGRAEFAVSPDQGGGARVIVYRGNSFLQTISFLGIDDIKFRGGARVGMADINGDGRADLLVSAGFQGGPRVAGFEGSGLLVGVTKKLFNDFFAFEPGLRNGAFVTGGDVNGDGFADLVAGAGPGGAPRVTVYDGASLMAGKVVQVASFFTGNNESRGGVRVAVADVDADGLSDVITGEADGPRVNLFFGKNVKNGLAGDDLELMPFSTPLNGVFVG